MMATPLVEAPEVARASAPAGRFRRFALWGIVWYQRAAEGRPSPCRFTPSCSSYAHESFESHSTGRAAWLTFRRFTKCRPFGPSGYDPVPDPPHVHESPSHEDC